MRYVLYEGNKTMAPLLKELAFIRHYVDLMKIRYTDKVRISVSLPTSPSSPSSPSPSGNKEEGTSSALNLMDIQVPSLLFTTFVENAFKHGVSYQQDSFIEISVRVDEAALDYLLKPFGMGDIMRAADKVKRQYDLMHTASLSLADEDDALFLKTEYKVVRILIHDIIYVEGMAEYLRIHLAGQDKPIVVLLSMKKMEERLPSPDFMRIHKSYIINLHHIAEINKSRVVLDNEKDIPIGDSYREKLNDYINQKFLGK